MPISAGQNGVASDFINESAGAGDSGKVPKLNADGVLDKSFIYKDVQEFLIDGTWTKPTKGEFVIIEVWGAGASGGAISRGYDNGRCVGAGGGGGGEYVKVKSPLAGLGATETVVVGDGGVAVISTTSQSNGNDGGVSSFGSLISADGGKAGGTIVVDDSSTYFGGGGGGAGSTLETHQDGSVGGGGSVNSGSASASQGGSTPKSAGGGGGSTYTTGSVADAVGGTSYEGDSGGSGDAKFLADATATGGDKACGGGGAVCTKDGSGITNTATSGKGGDGFVRVTTF